MRAGCEDRRAGEEGDPGPPGGISQADDGAGEREPEQEQAREQAGRVVRIARRKRHGRGGGTREEVAGAGRERLDDLRRTLEAARVAVNPRGRPREQQHELSAQQRDDAEPRDVAPAKPAPAEGDDSRDESDRGEEERVLLEREVGCDNAGAGPGGPAGRATLAEADQAVERLEHPEEREVRQDADEVARERQRDCEGGAASARATRKAKTPFSVSTTSKATL